MSSPEAEQPDRVPPWVSLDRDDWQIAKTGDMWVFTGSNPEQGTHITVDLALSRLEVGIELEGVPRMTVVEARTLPQLAPVLEGKVDYVLVQPDIVSQDWRFGWLPVGDPFSDANELHVDDHPSLVCSHSVSGFLTFNPDKRLYVETGRTPLTVTTREGYFPEQGLWSDPSR